MNLSYLYSNWNSSETSISSLNSSTIPPVVIHSALVVILFRIFLYSSFYYVGLFFPFGLIFNAFLLLVFGMSPMGTTKTTRLYYLAMAYGELGAVIFKDAYYFWGSLGLSFATGGVNIFGPFNPLARSGSYKWMCSVHGFLWYSHEMFANYIFLLFEFERVVAVYSPFRVRHFFTMKRTLFTVHT